jgi:hypothetical protein
MTDKVKGVKCQLGKEAGMQKCIRRVFILVVLMVVGGTTAHAGGL